MFLKFYLVSISKRIFITFVVQTPTLTQTDTLTAEQAKTMINKELIVTTMVAGARLFDKDGNKTFLINLDKRYPQSPLTVVLEHYQGPRV
jgi:carbohydrate-binding DOMON domain-containing protein